MAIQDQVVWANVNLTIKGKPECFVRNTLLPEPTDQEEADNRSLLRLGGAIRTVEVVYTPEEMAEAAMVRATSASDRERQHDVDTTLPMSDQAAGQTEPGAPTLHTADGSPVVMATADDAAAQRRAARRDPDKAKDAGKDKDADKDADKAKPGTVSGTVTGTVSGTVKPGTASKDK